MNKVAFVPRLVPPAPVSDADALARLARGDTSALGEIYERHHRAVFRFVVRATSDGSDAEDIVHATFLTVPAASRSYDGRDSCRSWLLGIAARLLQRRRRSLARAGRMLMKLATELAGRPTQAASSPEHAAVVGEDVAALTRALARLTEAKRLVLVMAEVEGVPCSEIATALDIPIGTVWTRLHHARREVRTYLENAGVRR